MSEENVKQENEKESDKAKDQSDTIRICLLGGSGSGKTAFFCGIYRALGGNSVLVGKGKNASEIRLDASNIRIIGSEDGFFSDSDEDVPDDVAEMMQGMDMTDFMNQQYLIRDSFAPQTSDTTVFTLIMKINSEECCRVEIIDYAGELLDDSQNAFKKDKESVCRLLASCDAIIIIADGVYAAQHIDNPSRLMEHLGAARINSFYTQITSLAKRNNRRISTLIAITKSDHHDIPPQVKSNNFARLSDVLANNVYLRTIRATWDIDGSTGVIPFTAVGDKATDDDNFIIPDNPIEQKNADTALMFCLYNAANRMIALKDARTAELDKELKSLRIAIGKKAVSRRDSLRQEREDVQKRRAQLEKIRDFFDSEPEYFTSNINELHFAGISEIGEAADLTAAAGKKGGR